MSPCPSAGPSRDLYNEPGNYFLPIMSRPFAHKALHLPPRLLLPSPTLPLLRQTITWARSASPSQPLTAGLWFLNRGLNRFQLEHSDVISFHHYGPVPALEKWIRRMKQQGRPVLCTDYMARTEASLFQTHLPVFERENVGAINWGLVAGRTQTHFTWQDPPGTAEPEAWFHDILRTNGSAYDPEEFELLRRLTADREPCGIAPFASEITQRSCWLDARPWLATREAQGTSWIRHAFVTHGPLTPQGEGTVDPREATSG